MSGRGIDFWYRLGRGAARVLIPTFGHIEVVGRENVPPYGPLIIAPNHQSNADPPVLVYAIARPLWWMAKRELFSNPLSAYLMRGVHVHPINRDGRDLEALAWAQETLAADRAHDGNRALVLGQQASLDVEDGWDVVDLLQPARKRVVVPGERLNVAFDNTRELLIGVYLGSAGCDRAYRPAVQPGGL